MQPRAELLLGEADEENAAGRWRENSQREEKKKKRGQTNRRAEGREAAMNRKGQAMS